MPLTAAPAEPIRVLLVDDSSTVRRLVRMALAGDPGLSVVGEHDSGQGVLDAIAKHRPDVVLLDVEMPGMSGLDALPHIRRSHPRLPVVMFSTLTGPGMSATVEALRRGATDYVEKPSTGGAAEAMKVIGEKVKPALLRTRRPTPAAPPASTTSAHTPISTRRPPTRVSAVVLACSTGGPSALNQVLPRLPGNFPVPLLIVQHMPEGFTAMLATQLDKVCALKVVEAADGDRPEAGTVHIAPGGKHMVVTPSGRIAINTDAPVNSCRPSADPLFISAARQWPGAVLGVVLTGMGADGTDGARHVVEAGGAVLAQDEASSVVWGMPGSVAKAGLVYAVKPLTAIADEMAARTHTQARP